MATLKADLEIQLLKSPCDLYVMLVMLYYLRGCLKCCLGVVGNGVPDPGVGNMNGAEEVGGRPLAPVVNLPQE